MNYKRTKYLTITKKRKINYFFLNNKSQITVVFFHGFMSDMSGAKPKSIQSFCRKKKLNFLKFEYSDMENLLVNLQKVISLNGLRKRKN